MQPFTLSVKRHQRWGVYYALASRAPRQLAGPFASRAAAAEHLGRLRRRGPLWEAHIVTWPDVPPAA